jgi:hypothetical protein
LPTSPEAVKVARTPRGITGFGSTAVRAEPTPPEASDEDVRDPLAAARRVGWVLFGLQLVAMVVFSTVEYRRFALTKDFAAYSQALWAMSHGHLDPFSTVFGTQFWRNNGEFLMWPLSLPYRIYPHPIALLWLQDVVVVLTGVVTFHWALDVLRVRSPRVSERTAVLLATAVPVVLVLDPSAYETIAFDFHSHVFAAFFLVLAGRDLWSGRHARMWCWVPLVLLSNAPGALYVAGLGLTGVLAGRRTRAAGASLIAAGAGWFLLLSAVGGDGVGGQGTSAWFGYLVGPHHGPVGVPAIAFGALRHPGLVGHMIELRWPLVVSLLLVVGLVGVCSPWGFGVALVVFLPATLAAPPIFLRFAASFQIWAALPFVLIGSLMIVFKLLANGPVGRRVATGILVGWGTCVLVLALAALPTVPRSWISVDAPAAAQLAQVERSIPGGAEVVASNGVVGRFAERDEVYVLWYSSQNGQLTVTASVPVRRPVVVFVFAPHQGVAELPGADQVAITYVRDHLHARVLVSGSGITAFAWSPPPGTTQVTLAVDGASGPASGAGEAAGSQSRQYAPQ